MLYLKEIRQRIGKSQQEVADFLKMQRASYANIENNKRDPDTATILAPDEGTAEVEFSNTYDGTGTGGHGILNSFTAQQGEDGYSWGGWEKPDMNNPVQDG